MARPTDNLTLNARLPEAISVYGVKRRSQRETWWQTIDAKWRLDRLKRIANLSMQNRIRLANDYILFETSAEDGKSTIGDLVLMRQIVRITDIHKSSPVKRMSCLTDTVSRTSQSIELSCSKGLISATSRCRP